MKKIFLSFFLAVAVLLPMFSFAGVSDIYAYEDVWTPKSLQSPTAVFSKDYSTKHTGEYSLNIQNSEYEDTWFSKNIPVEKYTVYKVSAMVKYEDYELRQDSDGPSGANISIAGGWEVSEFYNKNSWKKIELEFNSGSRTSVEIQLRNGFFYAACKGTAWFSNVRIEKKDMTPNTNWNFLCVIYKNIDVTVKNFKRNREYHHQSGFSQEDIDEITSAVKQIKKTFGKISDNLMTVANLSVFVVDDAITSITGKYNGGFCIEPEDIKETLDFYLSRNSYDQIIIVAPLGELANGWDGLGGSFYKNIGFAQVSHTPDEKMGSDEFPDAVFIHETLHCLESRAREIKNIADLHDARKYGYSGENDWIEWYGDYMKNALPDDKGLPKEVYYVYNGKYSLISSDMSVSANVSSYNGSTDDKIPK